MAKIALLNNDYSLAVSCLEDAVTQYNSVNAAYMLWQLSQSKSQVNVFSRGLLCCAGIFQLVTSYNTKITPCEKAGRQRFETGRL